MRQTRYCAVQAVAEKHKVVCARKCLRHQRRLAEVVVFVERQVEMAEAAFQIGQSLFPVFFEYECVVLGAAVEPFGGAHGGMRTAVYAAEIGERIERRAANHKRNQRAGRRPQRPSPRRGGVPEREQHPRAEQRQQRRYRQQIAHELYMKRPGYQEVRHNPAQQQRVEPCLFGAQGQCGNQRKQRYAGRQRQCDDVLRKQQKRYRQSPANRQVRQARAQRHAAQ